MLIKRVAEKIGRPMNYLHIVNVQPKNWTRGYYSSQCFAEGGSGAPRLAGLDNWTQGAGTLGGTSSGTFHYHEKPTISVGPGGRFWDGTKGRDTVFGKVTAVGGSDGVQGPFNSSPYPFGEHEARIFNDEGAQISVVACSTGGRGWATFQNESAGLFGQMVITLGAGVL